jgi:hypothetical protein
MEYLEDAYHMKVKADAPMQRVAETAKLLCIPFFLKSSKDIFPYRSVA